MSTEAQATPDPAKAFATKLVKTLNDGALCLMISVGHRAGLYDAISTFYPEFVSSQALADKAKLNERYVREWLGAMVVGGIIEYNSESKTYRLPKDHAAFMVRESGPKNVAIFGQWISLLGSVEDRILECFKNGGGVPHEAYHRVDEVLAEKSSALIVPVMQEMVVPGIPGLLDKLKKGSKVLDIGCGRGFVMLDLAKRYPGCTFRGYDYSSKLIADANADVASLGLANVSFHVQNISKLEEVGEYDVILAMDVIHHLADPAGALKGANRALKGDGLFVMQDVNFSCDVEKNVNQVYGPALYADSLLRTMTISLSEGGLGLGAVWGTEVAQKMLKENGFNKTEIVVFPEDFVTCWFVNQK